MKIKELPGEFGFRALVPIVLAGDGLIIVRGYCLSDYYYFSKDEVQPEWKWPVEVHDDGSVYIPHEDELQ